MQRAVYRDRAGHLCIALLLLHGKRERGHGRGRHGRSRQRLIGQPHVHERAHLVDAAVRPGCGTITSVFGILRAVDEDVGR